MPFDTQPLVSCIMPTADRRSFVPQAIEYFLRQDYANKELIVVDDGADAVSDLMPEDERVRYFRLNERWTVGAKRNFACEQARGEFIAHWDDDDWHAPHRLSYQAEAMLKESADVCGINTLLFYDAGRSSAWQYAYPPGRKMWLSGSTLVYTRSFWELNRFANINVGEDARFVWSSRAGRTLALSDSTFHVGLIHQNNVSPKRTGGAYWRAYPAREFRKLLGDDWFFYHPEEAPAVEVETVYSACPTPAPVKETPCAPVRNVYACLVHESEECVVDLMRNLRYHDPASVILLYNGGPTPALLNQGFPFEQYGAVIHPDARPMRWGWLHDFALDSMQFALENFSFDTLTIVDSDQLCVRSGYSDYLGRSLANQSHIGLLGNSPAPQPRNTRIAPAVQALKEVELWRPFLRRFTDGEAKFVYWTFWPSTIFTADAARDLVELFRTDTQLGEIMSRSKIWATEEIIFPTLVALLGYHIVANPCSYDLVKYRVRYSIAQITAALNRPDTFWVHPVKRQDCDPLRKYIRTSFNHYERGSSPVGGDMQTLPTEPQIDLPLTLPILKRMREIEGWLEDDEADLLIAATAHALHTLPKPHRIVEVGSYCGRSTFVIGSVVKSYSPEAKVSAIDPHDGKIGALDQGIQTVRPTLERFKRNIAAARLTPFVELIQKCSHEVDWAEPIILLFIDRLHDYANVARDFFHFEKWIVPAGFVAFHDYAPYYPGVQTFVNEILRTGRYRQVHLASSMIVVQKLALEMPQQECLLEMLKDSEQIYAPAS